MALARRQLIGIAAVAAVVVGFGAWRLISAGNARHVAPDAAAYVASSIREPFHLPSCRWAEKISRANLVGLSSPTTP